MQPPAAGVARSSRNAPAASEMVVSSAATSSADSIIRLAAPRANWLHGRQARVGEREPLDQDRHEGAIEAMPADVRGAVEVLGPDLDDARCARRRAVRAALPPVLGKISHLPEAFPRLQN